MPIRRARRDDRTGGEADPANARADEHPDEGARLDTVAHQGRHWVVGSAAGLLLGLVTSVRHGALVAPLVWAAFGVVAVAVPALLIAARSTGRWTRSGQAWESAMAAAGVGLGASAAGWWLWVAPFETAELVIAVALFAVAVWALAAVLLSASTRIFLAYTLATGVVPVIHLATKGDDWTIVGLIVAAMGFVIVRLNHHLHQDLLDDLRDQRLARRRLVVPMADPMVSMEDDIIIQHNDAFAALLGRDGEPLIGYTYTELVDADRTAALGRTRGPSGSRASRAGEEGRLVAWRRQDAPSVVTEIRGGLVPGGGGLEVWICLDVTERLARERQLLRRAERDDLTGLLGRRTIHQRIAAAPPGSVVLLVDLDGFKEVNDEHGHVVGDAVLEASAGRIATAVSGNGVVARLGGDEFVALIHPGRPAADVGAVAGAICEAVREPVIIDQAVARVSASIGVSRTTGNRPVSAVLHEADRHMYQAKHLGGDRWVDPN